MTAIWKIWSELPLPQAFTSTGWWPKALLGPTSNFDRTYLCNGTWYQQSERHLSIYGLQGLPYMPPNLMNCGRETAKNGWRVCARPIRPKFLHWDTVTASLAAWTLYNRQQANLSTCYIVARACSLEQENARRAHAGLCHASSLLMYSQT